MGDGSSNVATVRAATSTSDGVGVDRSRGVESVERTRTDDRPLVSVILTTNDRDRYGAFVEATESVLAQSYPELEVVLVVDEDRALAERIDAEFGDDERIRTYFRPVDEGLSAARNHGAVLAAGDIVVFTDDDVVADPDWVAELVGTYERHGALAAGGPAEPIWPGTEPVWLPGEFYWLVGATHDGFAPERDESSVASTDGGEQEVRNTFGCNIAFDRGTFLALGGFREDLGKQAGTSIQGEEAELCARLRNMSGEGLVYNPDARVGHRVFPGQVDPFSLCERAFWQGYSKRRMESVVVDMDTEAAFLDHLVREAIPTRIRSFWERPSLSQPLELLALVVLTSLVGCGYVYGAVESAVGVR